MLTPFDFHPFIYYTEAFIFKYYRSYLLYSISMVSLSIHCSMLNYTFVMCSDECI